MNLQKKDVAINNFIHSAVPVLILQINCGAVGLNLQVASRVYITSPHWNPCVEVQAVCRAHRKLQTQAVTFVRLVMRDTVEHRCLGVQQSKTNVISETLNDDSVAVKLGNTGALTFKDLRKLFVKRRS
jgi:SNF2 family DNA or RNA helicase